MLMRLSNIWIFVCLGIAVLLLQTLWPQPNLAENGDESTAPSVVYLADLMKYGGIFKQDAVIGSANGSFEFMVENGGAAYDSAGGIPAYIAIIEAENLYLPPPPDGAVIRAYDVSPSGMVFMPPLTLSVKYPDGRDPGGNDYIAWWNGRQWVGLPSVVNSGNATVSAKVRHFTRFAIIDSHEAAAPPTLPETELQVSELKITPDGAGTHRMVAVSVLVTNPETFNATGTLTLSLNDKLLLSQEVALPGAGEQMLVFTVAADGPGSYRVSVNQVSQTFVVAE
jgi:hypothetical protein